MVEAGGSRRQKGLRSVFGSIALAGLLAACSTVDGLLDQNTESPDQPPVAEPLSVDEPRSLGRIGDFNPVQPPPPLAIETPRSPEAADSLPSGTVAGDKALQIGVELARLRQAAATHTAAHERLRASITAAADNYRSAVASLDALTGGNSATAQRLDDAEARLGRVGDGLQEMEALRSRIVSDAALAGYLLEQTEAAAKLAGTVDEDRQQLQQLKAEGQDTLAALKAVLGNVDADIVQQSAYLTRERRDLGSLVRDLKRDELYGSANEPADDPQVRAARGQQPDRLNRGTAGQDNGRRAVPVPPPPAAMPEASPPPVPPKPMAQAATAAGLAEAGAASREPLMEIAFGATAVDYEAALYAAVNQAVVQNPSASFEVVAVSSGGRPGASVAAARQHAERVARSLINMGVPAGRLKQSARSTQDSGDDRVLVFTM